MKICYFADGQSVHTRRWMQYFADRGHEMHLISYSPVPEFRAEKLSDLGIQLHGNTGNFHLKKPWLTLRDLRFVKAVLRREKIDILHSHFLGANAWLGALSGFHPYIITIMGGGDVNGPDWKPDSSLQARFLTPFSLRNADHITSWSKTMADVIEPYCQGVPIDVIHGGIHLDTFVPGAKPVHLLERWQIPQDAKIVFSPRLMRPLSNIVEMAQAADYVSRTIPNSYYLVAFPNSVVDSDYVNRVKEVFESGQARDRVRFVSELSHNEIADYHRLADVTVSIPSTDGTPMTVLESMACGTPTVIGDLPDYDREYFENGKTTMMVDVKDPESIADGILKILNDEVLAHTISTEARQRVEATGGYEYQMAKMESIYRSFLPAEQNPIG